MKRPTCFFIMPFRPELHFVWLYLSQHIEKEHQVDCLRGDSAYDTIPLHEKIRRMIEDADFIVADITGRNPNVMYELGVAEQMGKKIIALHQKQEGIDQVPSDIKYKEFILYSLDDHLNLISQLDRAIDDLLNRDYRQLFDLACDVLREFNAEEKLTLAPCDRDVFVQVVRISERTTGVPDKGQRSELQAFLLPKVVKDGTRPEVMERMLEWLKKRDASY
jgi:nucleoside 2-deoxyribosyltransferase